MTKNSGKLYCFVINLRKAWKRKKEGLFQKELTEERIERLNAINFVWEPKNPSRLKIVGENIQFDHLYDLLTEFKQTYGHVMVSKMMQEWRKSPEDGPAKPEFKRLPFFISSARSEHELYIQGKPCALDEEKVKKLTALGIKWKRPASEPRHTGGSKRRKTDDHEDTVEDDTGVPDSGDTEDCVQEDQVETINDEESADAKRVAEI